MKITNKNIPLIVFCCVLALISVLNIVGITMISPKAEEFASSGEELPGITLAAINLLSFLMPLFMRILIAMVFAFVVMKFPKTGIKITIAVWIPVALFILVGITVPYL